MLPNFICPGAARSATTTLYYLLIQHPDIFLPSIKETRFFAIDYDKGLDWYESRYYSKASNETAVGDISPAYLIHDECPKRIRESLGPDVKFIFMLRHPTKRVLSHYHLLKRMQIERLPLEQALAAGSRKEESLRHFRHEYGFRYIEESTYTKRIERYLEHFPMSNMKFVIFEEFTRDIPGHLADITGFLGVRRDFEFNQDLYKNQNLATSNSVLSGIFYRNPLSKKLRTFIQMNTGWHTQVFLKKLKNVILSTGRQPVALAAGVKGAAESEVEARLNAHFEDEIRRLSALIGKDLSVWER